MGRKDGMRRGLRVLLAAALLGGSLVVASAGGAQASDGFGGYGGRGGHSRLISCEAQRQYCLQGCRPIRTYGHDGYRGYEGDRWRDGRDWRRGRRGGWRDTQAIRCFQRCQSQYNSCRWQPWPR